MKTSNIILLSFCFLILLFLSTFFIRQKSDHDFSSKSIITHEAKLGAFTYLKLMPGAQVSLSTDLYNHINVPFHKDSLFNKNVYKQNGDTLIIYPHRWSSQDHTLIGLYVTDIKCIEANKSTCFYDLSLDSLTIIGSNHSTLNSNDIIKIQSLEMTLTGNSIANSSNITIKSFKLNLDNSEYYYYGNVRIESAIINARNYSKASICQTRFLESRSDSTSRVLVER